GSIDTLRRLKRQAEIQLEGRRAGEPRYRLLPFEAGRGFSLLPEPSPGDVFFDLESDPFAGPAGIEYLFGTVVLDDKNEPEYHVEWVRDDASEKRAFEAFIDAVAERLRVPPDMPVYHFPPYEPAALKRLMGRHATREDDVDRLLRGHRLVDLLAVTRQGLQ